MTSLLPVTFFFACLNEVFLWFSANGMSVNPNKTDCLLVSTPQGHIPFCNEVKFAFSGFDVTPSQSIKYLGVILDKVLSFDKYCASIAGSVKSVARSIRYIRTSLTTEQATTLAVSLGLSKLDHANIVLSGISKKKI
jgi:hypothetical protein